MKLLVAISVCLTLVAAQNTGRTKSSNLRQPAKPKTDDFVDDRSCAVQPTDASSNHDEWSCLCSQLGYKREGCEDKIKITLNANPNLKLCVDQPNFYFGVNQKCHYEASWESSNNPAGKALQFAIDLFQAADPKNPEENFIISPLSPQILLAQLTDGCSESARMEMIKALRLNSREASSLTNALVEAANKDSTTNKLDIASIFFKSVDISLTEKFTQARKENKIKMRDMDFSNTNQAVQEINDWASHATRGNIPQVVTEQTISPDMSMLLLNAIFFKGTWLYKFNKTDTKKRSEFEVSSNQRMPVQMMEQSNKLRFGEINFGQYWDPEWGMRWVELPYDGDQLAMILLLPKARHRLDDTLKQVNSTHLLEIFKFIRRDYNPTVIQLKVPKFTIRDSISLVPPLKKLGVKKIFEDDSALSGLSSSPSKVGDVKQDTFLSVDESGTTAAAVSKITIIPLSLNSFEDIKFICDEPFLAMIVDKTREIPLFMAKINKPLKPKPKRG